MRFSVFTCVPSYTLSYTSTSATFFFFNIRNGFPMWADAWQQLTGLEQKLILAKWIVTLSLRTDSHSFNNIGQKCLLPFLWLLWIQIWAKQTRTNDFIKNVGLTESPKLKRQMWKHPIFFPHRMVWYSTDHKRERKNVLCATSNSDRIRTPPGWTSWVHLVYVNHDKHKVGFAR